jgi:hypothetical protein
MRFLKTSEISFQSFGFKKMGFFTGKVAVLSVSAVWSTDLRSWDA